LLTVVVTAVSTTTLATVSSTLAAVSTAITTVVAIAAVTAVRAGLAIVLFFVNPAFHSNDSVNGAGFGEAVIKRDAEGLEGHLAFTVAFGPGDVGTAEAACATDADAFGSEFHGCLQ
jgi:hypothetical protein